MKQQIDDLFNREMTRKEFLQYAGAALLAVVGITGMLKALSLGPSQSKPHQLDASYGSSGYGGTMKR